MDECGIPLSNSGLRELNRTIKRQNRHIPASVKNAECLLGLDGTEADADVRKALLTLVHLEARGGRC